MSLRIENPTGMAPEVLSSYEIELRLTTTAGLGSGTLNFNSASVPSSDYVFDGLFSPFPPPSFSGPAAMIKDFTDVGVPGATILGGASFALLDVDFDKSSANMPSGLFFVELLPFDEDKSSHYTTFPDGDFTAFAGPLVIGSITVINAVAVPEPSTRGLLCVGIGFAFMAWRSRTRRCRWSQSGAAPAPICSQKTA